MDVERWVGDTRGIGITDGTAFLAEAQSLSGVLEQAGWVAEDPEAHLLPHLARACHAPDSPWTITAATMGTDGVFLVTMTWAGPGPLRVLRRDVFALVGEIAEATTHVRQIVRADALEYRVITGMLTGDSPFAAHGHLVTIRIGGPRVPDLLAGMGGESEP